MSYPSGRTGPTSIVSSIEDKKASLESCLGGGLLKTQEKTKQVSKTKSLDPRPLLQKLSLNAIVPPKPPPAVTKPLLFAGKSKSERDAADYHPSNLELTPGSKMKMLALVTKAQMQEAGTQNTFKMDRKETDSESSSSSRNSKQTIELPLVSGPPKPPFTNKPSLTAQMTILDEKALEPDAQGPVDDPSPPPKKTLPNVFVLGKLPPKPNRPPRVQLEKFTKVKRLGSDDSQQKWTGPVPPNLPSSLPKIPPLPSLTPTFPSQAPAMRANPKEECSYDNDGVMDLPANPPSAGRPRMEPENGDLDEMYEDIETTRLPPPDSLLDEADNKLYDDDAQDFPPPLPISSPQLRNSKGKQEEKNLKRQKKLEKEFRKKFKFQGEIQVLYRVSVIPVLMCKKWGNKDLPLQPGEPIDVIVKPVDDKLIGRNRDGKFGYISTSNIVPMNNEIYDDVTEGYIYDND